MSRHFPSRAAPLVSIVTPCLNPGWRLGRCIDSLRKQTYALVEHVVVDGGSSDGTQELLSSSEVTRWISEPDSGQTDAINKGLAMSNGEVVGWIGADDTLAPGAIEAGVSALLAAPRAGWAYGQVDVVTPQGNWLFVPPDGLRARDFEVNNPVPQPGALITRQALDAVGPLDGDLHYSMDMDLWMSLLDQGFGGVRVPSVLAHFEVHEASKGGSGVVDRFLEDSARVRLKHGREPAAAATAGRVAAYRGGISEEGSVTAALDAVGCDPSPENVARARASRAAQRVIDHLPNGRWSELRGTLRSDLFSDEFARRLLLGAVRSRVARSVGRPPPQRW